MTDVREVKLNLRYPESRQEDITDAFMRGYTNAVEIGNKAIEKRELEINRLRTQLADVTESMGRVEERCAKLREQAEKAWKAAEMLCQAWDGPCRAVGASIKPPCPLDERDELCVYGQIQRDLRELGVEVD